MTEITTINEMLDRTARGQMTLDEAVQMVRDRKWQGIQDFQSWEWPGHADLATINEDVLWPLQRIFRDEPAKSIARQPERYRFTCPKCGDHRDTTIPGHCDDCEA